MHPPLRPPVVVYPASEGERTTVVVSPGGVDLAALERALIVFALKYEAGNQTHAARFLRLTRSALLYRMQKHHLHPRQDRAHERASVG